MNSLRCLVGISLVCALSCTRDSEGKQVSGTLSVAAEGATVVDAKTGLTWQREPDAAARSWPDAELYCASLRLAGLSWRLPSTDEMRTILVKAGKSKSAGGIDDKINNDVFPRLPRNQEYNTSSFWTSTIYLHDGNPHQEYVDFDGGSWSWEERTRLNFVRCVSR
jgi:hypothetical protein